MQSADVVGKFSFSLAWTSEDFELRLQIFFCIIVFSLRSCVIFWGLFVWANVYLLTQIRIQASDGITSGRTSFSWSVHLFYYQDLLMGGKCHSKPITEALRKSFAVDLVPQKGVAVCAVPQICTYPYGWSGSQAHS